MKIIKYFTFTLMFLLNFFVMYYLLRLLYIYYRNGAANVLADSRFDNAREIYMLFQAIVIAACCLVLYFSLKKFKSSPGIAFILTTIPILYFITVILVLNIF